MKNLILAMKKIKKAAEKIIENDKKYLKMDVMKVLKPKNNYYF